MARRLPLMAALATALLFTTLQARAQDAAPICGTLLNAYGPFDYRKDRPKLPIVELHHFNAAVESLVKGITGSIGGDIDYTLRAFPNHHRALIAMTRLSEKEKTSQPYGANYTIDCYYDRALRLAPDDNVARMLYARFLGKNKRMDEALLQLANADKLSGDNGFTHYNIGMVYTELGRYDLALQQAHRALELGFTRTELRQILEKAGKWRDPVATSASAGPAASPSLAEAPAAAASR